MLQIDRHRCHESSNDRNFVGICKSLLNHSQSFKSERRHEGREQQLPPGDVITSAKPPEERGPHISVFHAYISNSSPSAASGSDSQSAARRRRAICPQSRAQSRATMALFMMRNVALLLLFSSCLVSCRDLQQEGGSGGEFASTFSSGVALLAFRNHLHEQRTKTQRSTS
jgi:hypothetical protein